jgi:hypothetical protein
MKNVVLAAIAVLTLGVASASAQSLVPPHVIHWDTGSQVSGK